MNILISLIIIILTCAGVTNAETDTAKTSGILKKATQAMDKANNIMTATQKALQKAPMEIDAIPSLPPDTSEELIENWRDLEAQVSAANKAVQGVRGQVGGGRIEGSYLVSRVRRVGPFATFQDTLSCDNVDTVISHSGFLTTFNPANVLNANQDIVAATTKSVVFEVKNNSLENTVFFGYDIRCRNN